ncbi:DNA glycosylase [Mrakia frigida]|uniref:A/G-specific adenine glycosylase n=1 Tax=Mrakia frigida TaxID=29902 RepID=UPI003FCC0D72
MPSVSSSASSLLAHSHSTSYHSTTHVSSTTRQALLDWFDQRRDERGMPWRKRFDKDRTKEERGQRSYEIMIAEVMLQQTQVATVIGFYQRWMEKFPTIYDLAKGSQEDVHALWTGLGYYSRATRLLLAAQKVVAEYDGILPSSPKVLQADIPGIGPYTAGAVASIAYGIQAPLIDGNVNRVFSRLLGVYADPAKKAATTLMWESAGELVPKERPGDWNEALMELGATVCKPTEAKCDECPLSRSCRAYAENSLNTPPKPPTDIEDLCDLCSPFPSTPSTTLYPMKAIKKKAREEETAVCVVEWRYPEERKKESEWLVVKRPEKGLLAGLYEFPSLTLPSSDSSDSSPPPLPSPLLTPFLKKLLSPSLPPGTKLSHLTHSHTPHASVPHLFSHIAMTYHVSHLVLFAPDGSSGSPPEVERGVWLSGKEEVEGSSMGTGGKKCWEVIWGGGKGKKAASTKTGTKSSRKKGGDEGSDGEGGREKKKGKVTQATISGFFKKREVVVGGQTKKEQRAGGEGVASSSAGDVKKPTGGAGAGSAGKEKGGGIKASARRFVILSEDEEDEEEVMVMEEGRNVVVVVAGDGEKIGD